MSTTTPAPRADRTARTVAVLAALLLAACSAHAGVTDAFTADFDISRGGVPLGAAAFSLKPARRDHCYVYTGSAHPNVIARLFTGEISDVSHFCIDDGKLRPRHFSHHVAGRPEKSYRLDFDWPAHRVTYTSEAGKHKTMALGSRALDPLSIHIAARRWVASADNPANLETRPFILVDGDEIKTYRLQARDGKTVTTPGGTFNTLRVERAGAHSRAFRFWLARHANWIPVRVEQEKGSGVFRLTLTVLEWTPGDDSQVRGKVTPR